MMTPLRRKMIDAMLVRGLSPRTHRNYLSAVKDLATYCRRTPDQLPGDELQAFFLYLMKERNLSPVTSRPYLNALRFFHLQVLSRGQFSSEVESASTGAAHP